MKFEIMNPSDKCFIEGDDFKNVCVATTILGEGFYGLQEVDGDLTMPPLNFTKGWFENTFNQDIETILNEANKNELADIMSTVCLPSERSSMNDIKGLAEYYAKKLRG